MMRGRSACQDRHAPPLLPLPSRARPDRLAARRRGRLRVRLAVAAAVPAGRAGRPRRAPPAADGRAWPATTARRATSPPTCARGCAPRPVRFYPSRGVAYESHLTPPPHLVGLRVAALDALLDTPAGSEQPVVVVSAVALSEKVPDPKLRPHGFTLRVGELLDLDEAAADLVAAGYERVDQVEDRGQFAVRGGLLDVYPATEERAVRVDLFDDEIESLRWFSTFTQRSLGDADVVEIAPAAELAPEHRELAEIAALENPDERPDVAELLPVGDFRELLDLVPGARAGDRRRRRGRRARAARPLGRRLRGLPRHRRAPPLRQAGRHPRRARARRRRCGCPRSAAPSRSRSARRRPSSPRARCARPSPSWRSSCARATRRSSPGRSAAPPSAPPTTSAARKASFEERRRARLRRVDAARRLRRAAAQARGRPRAPADPPPQARPAGRTARGAAAGCCARSPTCARATSSSTRTTASRASPASTPRRSPASRATTSTSSTRAPTRSSCRSTSSRRSRATSAPTARTRRCRKLGGTRWDKLKARARRAAQELAGELLNLYAERKRRRGHAFEPDSDWLREFEEHFPYRETPDQRDAIESVKGTWSPSARWTG